MQLLQFCRKQWMSWNLGMTHCCMTLEMSLIYIKWYLEVQLLSAEDELFNWYHLNFTDVSTVVKPVSSEPESGVHSHEQRLLWSRGHAGPALHRLGFSNQCWWSVRRDANLGHCICKCTAGMFAVPKHIIQGVWVSADISSNTASGQEW